MSNTSWTWIEIGATVVAPTVVLWFGPAWLGPQWGLVVALAFPVAFAVASMVREGRPSALAVLALVSVSITGGIGLLSLDARWFAVKEAAIPVGLGMLFAVSARTRFAVVPVLLDRVLDTDRTQAVLSERGTAHVFDGAARRATVEVGLVTAISGVLSAGLAAFMVTAPTGTDAFASQLGSYTAWSFGVVTLPVLGATLFVLTRAFTALETAAGVPVDTLLRTYAGQSPPAG